MAPDDRRVLRTLGFTFLAFMLVAGGPFGFEAAVRAAGPLPCFLGFVAFPLVWSLPQALITAELSSEFPDTGGNVLWATVAFGDLAGWLGGANGLLAALLDLALYPSLVAQALAAQSGTPMSPAVDWLVRVSVVIGVTGLNVWGLRAVSHFSAVSLGLVIVPFVVSLLFQLPAVISGGNAWAQVAAHPDWATFLPIMLWSYSGWDSLGMFAGEVVRPSVTYVRGVLLTLVAVTAAYAVPLLVSIQTHPRFAQWHGGAFVAFCYDVSPSLHLAAALAAVVSPMSTMAACLSASTRMAWALAGGGGAAPVRHLPRQCSREIRGAPVVALAAHAAILAAASGATFSVLVQLTVVLASVRILLNAAAFVSLRRARLHRQAAAARGGTGGGSGSAVAFAVPGGWPGVVAVTLPQVCVVAVVLGTSQREVLVGAVLVNAAAVAIFFLRALLDRRRHGRWWPRGALNLATAAAAGALPGPRGVPAPPAFGGKDSDEAEGLLVDVDVDAGTADSEPLLLHARHKAAAD